MKMILVWIGHCLLSYFTGLFIARGGRLLSNGDSSGYLSLSTGIILAYISILTFQAILTTIMLGSIKGMLGKDTPR